MQASRKLLGRTRQSLAGRQECSFCRKSGDQVFTLIAGPGNVRICDECVELCVEMIEEQRQAESGRP